MIKRLLSVLLVLVSVGCTILIRSKTVLQISPGGYYDLYGEWQEITELTATDGSRCEVGRTIVYQPNLTRIAVGDAFACAWHW
jgi:hypothetical protein